MVTTKIMIVLGEPGWTNQALHLVCAIGRRQNVAIVLTKMIPTVHPQMLGTAAGYLQFTAQDEQDLQEYAATAEDYGVKFTIQLCQYANYLRGIASAAQQLQVSDVLAYIPANRFAKWQQLQTWWLRQLLHRQKQVLHTLEQNENVLEWTPALVLSHSKTFR